MQNLDLNNYGVQEMDAVEMKECDGGILPLLIIGALLLSSCASSRPLFSNTPKDEPKKSD